MNNGEKLEDEYAEDIVGRIMRFEDGGMEEDEVYELFQDLVDSGMAWSLQGSYGRIAAGLIEMGVIHEATERPAPEVPRPHCF